MAETGEICWYMRCKLSKYQSAMNPYRWEGEMKLLAPITALFSFLLDSPGVFF